MQFVIKYGSNTFPKTYYTNDFLMKNDVKLGLVLILDNSICLKISRDALALAALISPMIERNLIWAAVIDSATGDMEFFNV